MKTGFRIVAVLLSLWATQAIAQSTVHEVYLDLDADASTGCSVVTDAGSVAGMELRLRATVDGDPPQVQTVTRALCDGAAFGAAQAQPAGYPVGLNLGSGGADVVEFSTALAGLGDGGTVPAAFVSSNAAGADLVLTTVTLPGTVEPPGPTPIEPAVIPATGWLTLLLLVGLTVWLARRHPGVGGTLVVIVMMGAGVAWAANFVADGQIIDWTGEAPVATDPANDASDGSAQIDIVAVFAATENARLHVRIDVRDLEPTANQAPTLDPQTFTLAENSAAGTAVGSIAGTDPDAGQTLTYAITGGNTGNAFAIDAATGAISVANAAALDFEAGATFALTVTATDDGDPALSATATITIDLDDVNEAPQIDAQTFAVSENAPDGTAVAAVVASDPDSSAPNATLTFAITGGNTGGAFAIDANSGAITVASSAAVTLANAPFALVVQVSDGGTPSLDASATITIEVTDQNDAPVFDQAAYAFTVAENSAAATAVGTLSATDPDAGQTLTYAIASGNVGNTFAVDAASGAITVADPAALDFETTPTFDLTVSVTDSGAPALSDTATVTVTLTDANDAPVADDAAFTVAENAAIGTSVGTYAATDPDATAPDNTLSYAITAGNDDGTFAIDATTGEITVADNTLLDFETVAAFALEITATDGGGLSDTGIATINVLDENEAPTLPAATRDVVEASPNGTPVGAPIAGIDPDTTAPNNTLTYAITGGNTDGAFQIDAATGQISVANSAAVTSATPVFTLSVEVTDGGGLVGSGTVTVNVTDVNDAPSFVAGPDQTSLEDAGPLTGTPDPWATAIDDNDPTVQALTFIVTADNPALFATQPSITPTGTLSYEAAPDANGSTLVTVVLQDDGGTALGGVDTSAPQTFTITVGAVNDAPLFTAGPNQSVLENAPAQTVPNWATGVAAGPANESGQTVAFAVTGNTDPSLFTVQPAVAPDGTLTYTPAPGVIGTATITLELADNGGTADGGVDTSAPQTFTISINNVNDAPSFTAGPPQIVLEDAGAQTVAGWATGIDDGDAGVTQALTFNITGNSNAALFAVAPAIDPATGTLTYTPAADANGVATITATLSDDGGTADGGVDTSAPQSFTITVTAVNDAPSFIPGAPVSMLENAGAQTIPWATAISAGPANEAGQIATFVVSGNTNPGLFATAPTIAANGTLTFTPATNTSGSADVTVVLQDDGGTANGGVDATAPVTLTITVVDVNAAPSFVVGAAQTVNEDAGAQTVAGWATAIDDGDAGATQALTFNITGNTNTALFAAGPSVAANGTLSYTPAANANGTATITLTLSDDGGTANGGSDTSAPQSFTITVDAVNDAPVFTAGPAQTIDEDAPAQTVPNWATGIGPGGGTDEAAQTLTFAVTGNTNPTLFSAAPAIAANGTLTYAVQPNASGTATLQITLSDNGGTANGGVDTSAPQTLVITVNNVNDAPSFLVGPNPTVLEDAGAQTINPWATAIDDGDPDVTQTLTFQIVSNDNAALFSAGPAISPAGVLTFTPAAEASGVANISVRLSDNGGTANGGVDASAPQVFTITVTEVNDAPLATPKTHATHSAIALNIVAASHTGELLDGASDPDDAPAALSAQLVAGSFLPAGAQVTLTDAATGSFRYDPPGGFSGGGSFQFRICDDGAPVGPVQCSAPQTVSINVTGPELWFVDAGAAGGGDGGLADPFTSLAAIPGGRGTGDRIFVASGSYAAGHTLNANEQVIGQAASGGFASLLGVVVPGNGQLDALPASGPSPSLGGGVTFGGNGGVLRGVTLTAGSGTAISAGAVSGIEVAETSIDASTTAANFNGTGASAAGVSFTSTRSTGGANGIVLSNLSGTFDFGTGTLSGHSGTTFQAGGTLGSTSYAGDLGKTAAGFLLDVTGGASGNLTLGGAFACTGACGSGGGNVGVRVAGRSGGTLSFTGAKAISGSAANTAILLSGNAGATLNFSGNTALTTTSGTGLSANGGGNLTINGQFDVTTTAGRAIRIDGMTLSGSTIGTLFTNGALGAGVPAVQISNSTTPGTFTLGQELLLDHDDAGESGGGVQLVDNTGSWSLPRWSRVTSSDTTALRASNAGTLGIGDIIRGNAVTTVGTAILVQNTTIAAQDLNFTAVSSFGGAVNGILLQNTGTLGGLVVTGTGAPGSGGTIANTSSHGIQLLTTAAPSFAFMQIQNTVGDGVSGSRTDGFSFINGSIDNSGIGGLVDASNIGFNDTAAGLENNLSGTVVITGNTLTNARYHGVDIFNYAGTLADVTVSNNTITSSTVAATSQGSGIRLIAFGSATTAASVTSATLANNVISNFPGGVGIQAQGGNANAAGPTPLFGTAGSGSSVIRITGNRIAGQSPANPIAAEAIVALVNGKGQGNFDISGNGTVANPITNVNGTAISHSAFGTAVVTSTISNNVIVANNIFAAQGIGVGTSNTAGFANTPSLTTTITGNNVSATDGNGILAVARDGSGTLRAKIQNNTVAAPLTGVRPGIRVDSGNGTSVNETVCVNISGNTSAGSGGHPGIGLRKQGAVATTNAFGVNGMVATASPGVETYVGGLNPAGAGVLLISASSGFSNCSLP
ncbi:beta strand repeat-containing protein [Chiayiivirga flava]|uniref:Cadherin domain-containing protein n=1 Tax=Chiayiivirga flava TaxID=659595 RepID=A0A7W8FZ16_9GAMM|nr:cadherin domain-containing protein [Chiayiivirga flava]MBB5207982.1 hypothetical protein [Chiayiivirga flava]